MTMKERIARAALDAYYPQSLISSDHPEREKFRRVAEAVLDALREPPASYMNQSPPCSVRYADGSYCEWYPPNDVRGAIWQAMIDAAKAEGQPE